MINGERRKRLLAVQRRGEQRRRGLNRRWRGVEQGNIEYMHELRHCIEQLCKVYNPQVVLQRLLFGDDFRLLSRLFSRPPPSFFRPQPRHSAPD